MKSWIMVYMCIAACYFGLGITGSIEANESLLFASRVAGTASIIYVFIGIALYLIKGERR